MNLSFAGGIRFSSLLAALLLTLFPATAGAQQSAAPLNEVPVNAAPPYSWRTPDADAPAGKPPAPPAKKSAGSRTCAPSALDECLKDVLRDQAGIWTSPARLHSRDALWLLPFAGGTAAAISTDRRALEKIGTSSNRLRISNDISRFGSLYATLGVSGAAYLIGSLAHRDTFKETGLLGAEAIVDSAIVVGAFKLATNRERPDQGSGRGGFWPHGTRSYPSGTSFPSMHAAGSWALARVIAGEYPNPVVKILGYGWATAVSVSRVTGRKHFPSDVLVGGTFGYLIGGYVLRHHAEGYRNDSAYSVSPYVNEQTGSYGLAIWFHPKSGTSRPAASSASRVRAAPSNLPLPAASKTTPLP